MFLSSQLLHRNNIMKSSVENDGVEGDGGASPPRAARLSAFASELRSNVHVETLSDASEMSATLTDLMNEGEPEVIHDTLVVEDVNGDTESSTMPNLATDSRAGSDVFVPIATPLDELSLPDHVAPYAEENRHDYDPIDSSTPDEDAMVTEESFYDEKVSLVAPLQECVTLANSWIITLEGKYQTELRTAIEDWATTSVLLLSELDDDHPGLFMPPKPPGPRPDAGIAGRGGGGRHH